MRRRDFLAALPLAACRTADLDHPNLNEAAGLIDAQVSAQKIRAATLLVRHGSRRFARHFGEAQSIDTVFLLASITKPMTAAGVMKLVEQGKLSLDDPAHRHLPEFTEGDRSKITVRHLLTHTSGLPDQLPDTIELRRRHAPLSDFVKRTFETPLLFEPGARVSYQSMGILLAAEIVERISGMPLRQWLAQQIFDPLGMRNTALGLGRFQIADTARSQAELAEAEYGGDPTAETWDWNSPYWRDLGAPWGGAHSTAPDVASLLDDFLRPSGKALSKETASAMITNQNQGLDKPWGVGWAVNSEWFGQSCSPRTFGHSGATGTLCWCDPERDLTFVMLTTLPGRISNDLVIRPVANLVSQIT